MNDPRVEEAQKLVESFIDELKSRKGEEYADFFLFTMNQRTMLEAMSDALHGAVSGDNEMDYDKMWEFISKAASMLTSQYAKTLDITNENALEAFKMAVELHNKVSDLARGTEREKNELH